MKQDEAQFLAECRKRCRPNGKEWPRDIIDEGKINHKRAWYLLDKWTDKGIYNWGTCVDLGWFEDA